MLTVGTYDVPAELQTLHVVPNCTEFGVQYEGAAATVHIPEVHACPEHAAVDGAYAVPALLQTLHCVPDCTAFAVQRFCIPPVVVPDASDNAFNNGSLGFPLGT